MSRHIRTKLSLHRETLRNLTSDQIELVGGGVAISAQCAEKTGIVGHCEQRQGTGQGQGKSGGLFLCNPGQVTRTFATFQPHRSPSIAYCKDRPPTSGYTLPPTARD